MTNRTSRFKYTRVATMHYEVRDRETGALLGECWRTYDGFAVRHPNGNVEGTFMISRDTAVGATIGTIEARETAARA